jgi:large subunit ribosomal protein L4
VDNVLIVADGIDKNLYSGVAKFAQGDVRDVEGADPVSLIAYEKVMITVDAIKKFEEALA